MDEDTSQQLQQGKSENEHEYFVYFKEITMMIEKIIKNITPLQLTDNIINSMSLEDIKSLVTLLTNYIDKEKIKESNQITETTNLF